jgi:hypothetical protein
MATTYVATKAGSGQMAKTLPQGVYVESSTYALTGALVVNDVIQMLKVNAGTTVLATTLITDDLDSGGSPAVVLAVGDGTTAGRFITGSTVAQAGGIQATNAAGVPYTYTVDDTVDVKCTTAPATGATTGNITLVAWLTRDL